MALNFKDEIGNAIISLTSDITTQPFGIMLSTTKVNILGNDGNEDVIGFTTPDRQVFVNPENDVFEELTSDLERKGFFQFLLAHELGHRIFLSFERQGNRDNQLWNIATDMEIHNMFRIIGQNNKNPNLVNMFNVMNKYLYGKDFDGKTIKGNRQIGCYEEKYQNLTAEEIYYDLEKNSKKSTKQSQTTITDGNGNEFPITITETTVTLPDGKKIKNTEITAPTIVPTDSNNGGCVSNIDMNNLFKGNILSEAAKGKFGIGTGSSSIQVFLNKIFKVQLDWKEILLNAVESALEKSDSMNWCKPRTSLFGMGMDVYMPAIESEEEAFSTIIIGIDQSGSFSDDDCCKAIDVVLQARDKFKKLVIVKHDTEIKEVLEFDTENEFSEDDMKAIRKRAADGGTSHKECFEFISKWSEEKSEYPISLVMFITDLYSDIEETQKIVSDEAPVIYLAPSGNAYDASGINGQVFEMN